MQTLTAGSFLNLENASAVEALKFTARRLAEHTGSVITKNLNAPSLESLANSLWDKAEYVTRETEQRRLHQIFVENFSERFRELKPDISEAENSTLEVPPNYLAIENADSIKQPPAPEAIAQGENECVVATAESDSSSASSKENTTEVEGKRDEFLGFVKSGEPFGEISNAETDAPEKTDSKETELRNVQAGSETVSETIKSENQSDARGTPNSEKNRVAAEAKVTEKNPNDAKSQSAAATTAAKSNSSATDAVEPFEFGKCTINLNLVLLPCSSGDGNKRKAIVSATSHNLPPEIEFLEIAEGEDLTQITDLVRDKLARFKQTLPVKYIEQLRASKTKSAKKPAPAKATTAAPTQPAFSESNVEKESGEQETQEASGVETEKPQAATTAEESTPTASVAFVPTIRQAAANEIQGSLF